MQSMSGMAIFLWIFLGFLLLLNVLDAAMIISLVRPGDERRQIMVWKASTGTLMGTVGSLMIHVIEKLVRGEEMLVNPFIHLSVAALMYFVLLLYYKRKYGG